MSKRARIILGASAACVFLAFTSREARQGAALPEPSTGMPVESQQALVDQYCADCHNDALRSGGFSWADIDLAHPERSPARVEAVILKLRVGLMPPVGNRRPDLQTIQSFVSTLEATMDEQAALRPNPGMRGFQRLTRTEYARSIRDLFGIELDVSTVLPPDSLSGDGFDNLADAQGFSVTQTEGYIRAARKVTREALGDPTATAASEVFQVSRNASQMEHVSGAPAGTRGGISVTYNFPADGEYSIRSMLYPDSVGGVLGSTIEGEQLEVSIDGYPVALYEIDQRMHESQPAGMNLPPVRVFVKAGPHRVTSAFIASHSGLLDDHITPLENTQANMDSGLTGMITVWAHLRELEISGPLSVTGVSDFESRRRIFSCRPLSPDETLPCATKIIGDLAARAFRRPVTSEDLEGLMAFYDRGREAGDFESGIRLATQAILVSPDFVFRFEPLPTAAEPGRIYPVGMARAVRTTEENMLGKHRMFALVIGLVAVLSVTATMTGRGNDLRVVHAAIEGDREAVRDLIRGAADVNSALGDSTTALHWAAEKGDAEMAQLLIYAGANIHATTRIGGYTPLFMAAKRGAASVIDVLLKSGSDVNVSAINAMTPLMFAALSGNRESVRLLLEKGADVNRRESEHGQTALIFAAAYDRADVIEELIEHRADLNAATEVQEPASRPERPGRVQAVGVPLPPENASAPARQRGQPNSVASPAEQAQQQLQQLQQRLLAENERNPRSPRGGLTALMYAARDGSLNAIRALVEGGADLDARSADESTALLIASINGRFDVAKYLVEGGADLNLASIDGATPLYGVLHVQWSREAERPQPSIKRERTSYLDLMKWMLDRGADPNAKLTRQLWYTSFGVARDGASDIGTTPFWKSASVADIDGMQLLLTHGADPNISNKDGVTPLLAASGAGTHGNEDIEAPPGRMASVMFLVEELHADVNASDNGETGRRRRQQPAQPQRNPSNHSGTIGYTALHNAAARGDNEMILYLVSQGAKADAVTKDGVTIADMANGPRQRIQPYASTLALLETLGAKNNHKCVSC